VFWIADQFLKKKMNVELLTLLSILLLVLQKDIIIMILLSSLKVLELNLALVRMPLQLLMILFTSCWFPLISQSFCLRPFRFWQNLVPRYIRASLCLTCLSLFTDISTCERSFKRVYECRLWHIYKMFLAYSICFILCDSIWKRLIAYMNLV
jgi:hypothetical protein